MYYVLMLTNSQLPKWAYFVIATLLMVIGLEYVWFNFSLNSNHQELASTTASFKRQVVEFEARLASTTAEKDQIFSQLTEEQKETLSLKRKINRADDKIDELKKITETDPELLQKYSKVFFLSENYAPKKLVDIPEQYLYDNKKLQQFSEEAWRFLENMLKDAADSDAPLQIVSAYRSFGTQSILKSGYTTIYGSGANKFSADQGYSEHQLGVTVDLTTTGVAPTTLAFANTRAFLWLTNNAWRYGFVLSYPKGNSYYVYEPWHWRFVGRDLAEDLRAENKNFYDLDQRQLDTYLGKLFD